MFLFVTILGVFLLVSIKRPDFMFWIAVTVFMDPGGYIQTYIPRTLLGGLQISDLTFLLLFVPLISPKVELKPFFNSKDNQWFVYYLLIYTVFYHILVYGFIAPGGKVSSLVELIQYQRLTLWGFLAIIPAYIFFKRNHLLFFKFALITSAFLMSFFIIRFTTGLNIVPIWEFERSRGSNIMRIALLGYGFTQWFLYMLFIKISFRIQLPKMKWINFIAFVIFVAEMLTLTRRVLFSMIFQVFLVYYFSQKMSRKSIISFEVPKLLKYMAGMILLLYLVAPKYIDYSLSGINDTISIFQKGEDTRGEIDGRSEGDIPQHIARFVKSPVIGYGWDELWYSNKTEAGGLSANDVPLTAALGMFGILGLLLFTPFYLKVFKILFKNFTLLQQFYLKGIAQKHALLFTISLFLTINFTNKYTLGFLGYYGDLISGASRVMNMMYLGFLLAAFDLISNITLRENISNKYLEKK